MGGLLIVGAGGHGKVVADTAFCTEAWERIAFLDDRYPFIKAVDRWPILAPVKEACSYLGEYSSMVIALGDNLLRADLLNHFENLGFKFPSIFHPTAFISEASFIGKGSVVFAHAVVNAGAKVGFGCIINTGATVDHDCLLGNAVHLSPGVHLGGEVKIGNFSWLGIGSSVIHQVTIGEKVLVGAGSVVIENTSDNVTIVGVPGRVVKNNEKRK